MVIKYNEEVYDITLAMLRVDPNDTKKFLPEPYHLNMDFVSKMVVGNDLIIPIPSIMIEYIDKGNLGLEKYPADGRSILEIILINSHLGNDIFAHFFIVDDIQVLEKRTGENLLRLTGKSASYPILNSLVEFSSGEDMVSKHVETTKIAKDILESAEFPLDRAGLETDVRAHYTVPANATVHQAVNDLMEYSLSESKGMFYLIFNMVQNKGKILSLKETFENFDPLNIPNENIPARNIFSIPTNDGILTQYTIAYDFMSKNNILGSSTYNVVAESVRNNFSYLDRHWTQENFSYEKYLKILPKVPQKIMPEHQPLPQEAPKIIGDKLKFNEELPNFEYDRIHNKHFMMLTQLENIQFNTLNHMHRDVGQMLFMYTNNNVDAQRFGGFWMISRIHHVFTRGQAISNITAVRTMKLEGPFTP